MFPRGARCASIRYKRFGTTDRSGQVDSRSNRRLFPRSLLPSCDHERRRRRTGHGGSAVRARRGIGDPRAAVHLPSRLPLSFLRVEIEAPPDMDWPSVNCSRLPAAFRRVATEKPPVMDCPSLNSQSSTSSVLIVTASPSFSPMSSAGAFPSVPEIVPLPKAGHHDPDVLVAPAFDGRGVFHGALPSWPLLVERRNEFGPAALGFSGRSHKARVVRAELHHVAPFCLPLAARDQQRCRDEEADQDSAHATLPSPSAFGTVLHGSHADLGVGEGLERFGGRHAMSLQRVVLRMPAVRTGDVKFTPQARSTTGVCPAASVGWGEAWRVDWKKR